MTLIVQKFGGSSLSDLDRLRRVAEVIASARAEGHDVVVVVSAMGNETDRLIGLAHSAAAQPSVREYDALVATGEQVSSALLSIILNKQAVSAKSYSGAQASIETDSRYGCASIEKIHTEQLRADLQLGVVPVVAGFQGVDPKGNVTTFGRGGSDVTAVALAAALQADECQIYTDVDGVYTTDPRVVDDARRLAQITFDEMLELSSLGAKVLQSRAVEFANRHGVPLRVMSTFAKGPGTLVMEGEPVDTPLVSGIAFDRNQAKLSVLGLPNKSDNASQILSALSSADVDVDMIIQNAPSSEAYVDFSFTVHLDDYKKVLTIIQGMAEALQAREVVGSDHIAKLSVVGVGMHAHAGVASTMLQALGNEGIDIHSITSSEVKISAVVDEKDMEQGARALHTAFGLGKASSE